MVSSYSQHSAFPKFLHVVCHLQFPDAPCSSVGMIIRARPPCPGGVSSHLRGFVLVRSSIIAGDLQWHHGLLLRSGAVQETSLGSKLAGSGLFGGWSQLASTDQYFSGGTTSSVGPDALLKCTRLLGLGAKTSLTTKHGTRFDSCKSPKDQGLQPLEYSIGGSSDSSQRLLQLNLSNLSIVYRAGPIPKSWKIPRNSQT